MLPNSDQEESWTDAAQFRSEKKMQGNFRNNFKLMMINRNWEIPNAR